jgi:hypothetical protein
MPSVGIDHPISLLRPYLCEPRRAPRSPYCPLRLYFTKFDLRRSVQPVRFMSILPTNSSSSSDVVSNSDHFDDSLHQKTSLIMAYLHDMFLRDIVDVGRVVIVHPHAGPWCRERIPLLNNVRHHSIWPPPPSSTPATPQRWSRKRTTRGPLLRGPRQPNSSSKTTTTSPPCAIEPLPPRPTVSGREIHPRQKRRPQHELLAGSNPWWTGPCRQWRSRHQDSLNAVVPTGHPPPFDLWCTIQIRSVSSGKGISL